MQTVSKDEIKAGLQVVLAIGQAIREAGSIPSGHLYAALMGKMDLNTYQAIIQTLKQTGMVREQNHLLIWVEPKGGE